MTETAPQINRFIERPFDPTRKRFYMVDTDVLRNTHDFELLNPQEIFQNGQWGGGDKVLRLPAGKNLEGREVNFECFYGLPLLLGKPVIKIGIRNKPLDVYGNMSISYISPRAKSLLEDIDPGGFDFAECETFTRKKFRLESYWMMSVRRVVTEFDEERSKYLEVETPEFLLESGRPRILSEAYDIHMKPDMPDNYCAFRLLQKPNCPIFSENIVDRWRTEKLNSLFFTPLQTPTKKEAKSAIWFKNSQYYFESGRKYWGGKF